MNSSRPVAHTWFANQTPLLPFVAANVLEEEDERMYRLQNLKCRGVERIEVVLKVSRCSMLGYHAPLVNP
jgi:hypothetical protein